MSLPKFVSRLLAAAFLIGLIAQSTSSPYGVSHGRIRNPVRSQYGTSVVRLPLIWASTQVPIVAQPTPPPQRRSIQKQQCLAAEGYQAAGHHNCPSGRLLMACCLKDTAPSSPVTASPPSSISPPVLDFSAPKVDFECGLCENHWGCDLESRQYYLDGTTLDISCAQGGCPADVNRWPWAALLGWRLADGSMFWRCGGTLINSRWIVTSAHCLEQSPQVVRLGEHDFTNDADGATPKDFGIRRPVFYPEYSPGVAYHDIALAELDRAVQLHPKSIARPICLPWDEERTAKIPGRNVVLTGWGATQFGGEFSPVLQEVILEAFNASKCDDGYKTLPGYGINFPNGIRDGDFVCAGYKFGGRDACKGDSGGPISYNSIDHGFVLAGVVGKGYGCGLPNFPGLYTPLHREDYLSWIKATAFS